MNELVFFDMLEHYKIKTKEIELLIQDISAHTEACLELTEQSWLGESGTAIKSNIDEIMLELSKIREALSDTLLKLEAVENRII